MTTITFPTHATSTHAPAGLGAKPALVQRIMDALNEWSARSTGRRELARMSAAELKDIGLSASDAEWEAAKAPWQA